VRGTFEEQKDIKKCWYKTSFDYCTEFIFVFNESIFSFFTDVLRSGVGAFIWIVALISWVVVFQTQRVAWGDLGDELSFIIPTGSA